MSAKNRGTKSRPNDFYVTPESTILSFLHNYNENFNNKSILEPSAGNGAISKVIKDLYPNSYLHQVELREEEKLRLEQYGSVEICDFLEYQTNKKFDYIITNPPFTYAMEFVEKCHELAHENTKIIMLLRLNYLGSQNRFEFWQKYPVDQIYALSIRPSFIGNRKTDACEYGWFIWNAGSKDIKVIW